MNPEIIPKYWEVIVSLIVVVIGYIKLQGRVDLHNGRLETLEKKTDFHAQTLSDIRVFMENINVNMENIKRFIERSIKE